MSKTKEDKEFWALPYPSQNEPREARVDLEYLNPERALDAAIEKANEIVAEAEKQGGERDPRTQLVVDILWQVTYHRKNLCEYVAQLQYLVK